MTVQHIRAFDAKHDQALREIWFLGDVHASFQHIPKALLAAVQLPKWLAFLGDIEIDHTSFREILAPLRKVCITPAAARVEFQEFTR